MVADECELFHEGYCIGKEECGDDFECPGMVISDSVYIKCGWTNDDLIEEHRDKYMDV